MNNIEGYVERKLRYAHQYCHVVDNPAAAALYREEPPLHAREILIGVYENQPGQRDERILITDHGLHLFRHDVWATWPYSEMEQAIGLRNGVTPERKMHMDGFTIRLKSSASVWLPVRPAGAAMSFLGFILFVLGRSERLHSLR